MMSYFYWFFSLGDFASYAFLLGSTSVFVVQVDTKIGLLSAHNKSHEPHDPNARKADAYRNSGRYSTH